MQVQTHVSDRALREGAALRFCRHFPALRMAHSLGGPMTTAWQVALTKDVRDIITELEKRGIDPAEIKTAMHECACCHSTVAESPLYQDMKAALSALAGEDNA